jgi:hypothetical protein
VNSGSWFWAATLAQDQFWNPNISSENRDAQLSEMMHNAFVCIHIYRRGSSFFEHGYPSPDGDLRAVMPLLSSLVTNVRSGATRNPHTYERVELEQVENSLTRLPPNVLTVATASTEVNCVERGDHTGSATGGRYDSLYQLL